MSTIPLSFRVSTQIQSQLEELARATDRPKSWHLEQAVRSYLDTQLWQIRQIKAGLAELDAGKGIPHEQVVPEIEKWMKRQRKRNSKSRK
jgi:predicted transcriptional regulator